jgi:2-dehydropantoate 2-reductase
LSDRVIAEKFFMRILVVGAGAIGGYFGGRLLEAGRNVTFLVRARRNAQLAKTGLVLRSKFGDVTLPAPPTVTAEALREPFDLILLSCKAYDLDAAVESFAPAVGPNTAILPLLNGLGHLDTLASRFGGAAVLAGLCVISTTLDADGRILHLNDAHLLSFGERNGAVSTRAEAIAATFSGARFDSRLSKAIMQEMWEKWVLIASMAGINCLMRAAVGDIVAAGAANLATALLDECCAIAAAQGFPPSEASATRSRTMLTTPGSTFAASMLRDIERGAPIEADHILGDMVRRGEEGRGDFPLLQVAYAHTKAYETRRKREQSAAKPV